MLRPRHRLPAALAGALAVAGLAASARPATAAPDFTASTIAVAPEEPVEGDTLTFTVTLRNRGDADAGSAYLSVEWPQMGFLAGVDGLADAAIDHDGRTITTNLPLALGAETRFAVRVLAPRDSGGDALTLALRVSHFDSGAELWDRRTVTVGTRIRDDGVRLGRMRVTPAGIATLAVLVGGALLWLLLRLLVAWRQRAALPAAGGGDGGSSGRLIGPGLAALLVTVALGFWAIFAAMAYRDGRSLAWPETTCTVLGRKLAVTGTTRSSSTSSPRRDDSTYAPVLGLAYRVAGRDWLSSGYDTGSSLRVGGRAARQRELAGWTPGSTTRCWYDPRDPGDVVVHRGFGGAYVFAVLPLPLFLIGCARIASLLSRR